MQLFIRGLFLNISTRVYYIINYRKNAYTWILMCVFWVKIEDLDSEGKRLKTNNMFQTFLRDTYILVVKSKVMISDIF